MVAVKKIRNIKLTIEYDGTDFHGWQIQRRTERTVQGELKDVLKLIFQKETKVTGSGRTDTGVHAHGQVANFKMRTDMSAKEIQKALNGNLPADITVLKVEFVKPNFHAQYNVKSKTYRYTILYRDTRAAQHRNFCMIHPYELNVAAMRHAAKALVGKKDFKAFQSENRTPDKPKTTVRQIKKLNITKRGDFIYIDIQADGFLYKMVRNIVGTLLEVGSGRIPKDDVKEILKTKDRNRAGATAKAKGLSLYEVKY